jgi:uncharacterized protein YndB with AHSA1/START domain
VVYALITTEAGLKRWIAASAVVDASPGGELRWTHDNGATMVGRFIELVPDRRVVFTYGWEDALMGLAPEASTVEIELDERDGETTLRLVHRGIPSDVLDEHRHGWIYFLGKLREAAS